MNILKKSKMSISVEEAVDILGQKGFIEKDILKMQLDKFIDIVNKHIGKVENISFKQVEKEVKKNERI